jgi:hypothetical protein
MTMSQRTFIATLMTTVAAVALVACSSGPAPMPEVRTTLATQALAADDPVYHQARGLLVETSEDGRWTMNVVERGHGSHIRRQVILIDEANGQGYTFPQLTNNVSVPRGQWETANTFTFTSDYPAPGSPRFTLEVMPDALTGGLDVAFTGVGVRSYGTYSGGGDFGAYNFVGIGGVPTGNR